MKKYEIEVKGIQPIIWNVMKRELELERKELKKNELSDYEENRDNWIRKAEFNDEGLIIIPNRWFKSCLVESCKKNRLVPHFASRKNETYTNYVNSMMVFENGTVFKPDSLIDYSAYVGAQGKNSSTKVWRVRPMLKDWSTTFTVIDPFERMKVDELKEIINYAGLMIGMGDNRINNYGRFELVKLKEVS